MVGNSSPARTEKKTQKKTRREGPEKAGDCDSTRQKKICKTDGQLPARRAGGFGWWMTKISIINWGQDGVSEVDQDR